MLELTGANVAVRFEIDGAWHNAEGRDREQTNLILAVLMTVSGMDANQRAKKQEGRMTVEYKGSSFLSRLTTQPVEGGERAVLHLHPTQWPILTFGRKNE